MAIWNLCLTGIPYRLMLNSHPCYGFDAVLVIDILLVIPIQEYELTLPYGRSLKEMRLCIQ